MKNFVPIRLSEHIEFNYEFLTIQVMQKRYKSDFMGMLETIGYITFQRGIGETKWYGMRFKVDTNEFMILNNFHKLARKINSLSNYDTQPNEIINIIDGMQYFVLNDEWFNHTDVGLYCFNVMLDDELYAKLVAYNLDDANIKLNKFIKRTKTNRNYTIGKSFKIENK